jgi:hypothetical protein
MKLYTWPLDSDDMPLCPSCARRAAIHAAEWCEAAPAPVCECGKVARVECHDLPNPPAASRPATIAEERAIGFGCEDDDQCAHCGLFSMGGTYPVCDGCGICEDCGCECEVLHD